MLAESCFAGVGPNEDGEWTGGYSHHKGLLTTRAFFWAAPSSSRLVEVVWAARDKDSCYS